MRVVIDTLPDGDSPVARLEQEAIAIHEEDVAANQRMGELGAQLMQGEQPFAVITHCNTGSLATGGYGTALGVIRSAYKAGLIDRKSTRLNSSHVRISYAVFCLKKNKASLVGTANNTQGWP